MSNWLKIVFAFGWCLGVFNAVAVWLLALIYDVKIPPVVTLGATVSLIVSIALLTFWLGVLREKTLGEGANV